ncbi:MAG: metallophosphoesterase [Anaerolineae bacterium]|nr:metallophosphoesterase [Anaerolineae bacterium]MDQ7036494.1 metallophosphoesterase [Anaerolineae bacterium]
MPTTDNPLRFIHISDTHINPDTNYTLDYAQYTPLIGAQALVKAVNDLPFMPDFILHTGDVAYDPVPEVYPEIKTLLETLKAPIHYLVGNHDDAKAIQRVLMGRNAETIQDYLYYDFEVKEVHVVCLDSNGAHNPQYPSGTVTDEQLIWLNDICRSDDERPLVIAVHHNIIPTGVPWLDTWMRMENGEAFHDIVSQARARLCGVFFGHIHQNITTLRDGVMYVAASSSWCQFYSYPIPENTRHSPDIITNPGFNVVSISEQTTFIRRHTFAIK